MNKFIKVMLSLVLVFSIATINLDASSKVTKYSNENVKTRTYYTVGVGILQFKVVVVLNQQTVVLKVILMHGLSQVLIKTL